MFKSYLTDQHEDDSLNLTTATFVLIFVMILFCGINTTWRLANDCLQCHNANVNL